MGSDTERCDTAETIPTEDNYQIIAQNTEKEEVESEGNLESNAIQAKRRQFQCTFCQKLFQNSSQLKTHKQIHTGEAPFECRTFKLLIGFMNFFVYLLDVIILPFFSILIINLY